MDDISIKPEDKKLTPKQQLFVAKHKGFESLKETAKECGISYTYAKELHAKTCYKHVQDAIAEKREEFKKNCGIDQEWLLTRYKMLSDYHITDFFNDNGHMKPLSEIPKESIYAICGMDVNMKKFISAIDNNISIETFIQKFKLSDKKATLDSIAKMLGFTDKNLFDLPGDDVEEIKITFRSKDDKVNDDN